MVAIEQSMCFLSAEADPSVAMHLSSIGSAPPLAASESPACASTPP